VLDDTPYIAVDQNEVGSHDKLGTRYEAMETETQTARRWTVIGRCISQWEFIRVMIGRRRQTSAVKTAVGVDALEAWFTCSCTATAHTFTAFIYIYTDTPTDR